ncbi:MAG TPA: cyclic nucleotide-binding domain-containing protein [Trebonia sp.]|nr:cyclic nucleotide-binding domain-containing protein [Trebonia sp.]
MSAYPFDASGEEDAGEVVPGESPIGGRSRNRLELHLHRGILDIDLCLNGSRPYPSRAGEPVAGDGEYWGHRPARHGHQRRPHSKSRPETFRAAPETLAATSTFRLGSGPSASFWAALRRAEREQFRSRAELRTFAAGARLMREGETANHVVVILRGQTEVRVNAHGTERVLARRGPGQLLGERAALQVNVRSATVVALDTVEALVMQTADFAAFLSAHPAVLDIVENQVYFRLTEELPGSTSDDGFWTQDSTNVYDEPSVAFRRAQSRPFTGENCTIVYTDVVGFSSARRDDHDRLRIRRDLAAMTYAALKAIWDECFWDDRGDGSLVVVPPTVPTAKVLEYLLVALPIALKQHNENCAPGTRFQLRVALDMGAVVSDDIGVSGQVIINTKRLLDSPTLKRAVGDSDGPLGLVVSESVFQYAVRHARHVTDPAAYKKIRVRAKDISLVAWMSLVSSPVQVPPRHKFLLAAG